MKSLLLLLLALATPLAAGEPVQQSPIAAHVERAEARLAELLSVPSGERSFDNTARALDALAAELEAAAWPTVLLASVGTTEEERALGRLAEAELEAEVLRDKTLGDDALCRRASCIRRQAMRIADGQELLKHACQR